MDVCSQIRPERSNGMHWHTTSLKTLQLNKHYSSLKRHSVIRRKNHVHGCATP
jgi:hypothetical protein